MTIGWITFAPNAFSAIVGIYALLVVATVFTATWQTVAPQKDLRELATRIKTWWIMITTFVIALGSAHAWLPAPFVLFGFISFIALKEFLSMVPTRRVDRPVYIVMYLAIPFQYYFASKLMHHGLFQMAIFVYAIPLVVMKLLMHQRTEGFVNACGMAFLGMWVAIYSPSHIARLFALPEGANPVGGAIGLVLFVVVLTQGNDVAQYIWGKTLKRLTGGHTIVPLVSPNKTWEGFIGGVVTTSIAAYFIAPYLTPFSTLGSIGLGMVIAVCGFIGDVFVSAIKRDCGVKDASLFLPGHGGMLDRIDSLTIVAPLYFHLVYYFVYMKGGFVCSAVSCG